MSFGDGIATVQVRREERYGKFWAWVLLLKDSAVIGGVLLIAAMLVAAVMETLADWAEGSDTLVHVVYQHLLWFWHLLGRIGIG